MDLIKLFGRLAARAKPPWAAPIWNAEDPNGSTFAELLSISPTIFHVWPTLGFPFGAAGTLGPLLKDRPVHFLVMPSWSIEGPGESERLAKIAAAYLLDHPQHRLTFLCNTGGEKTLMRASGFAALTINQNCLMDDSVFKPMPQIEPLYDAVYNARLSPEKRLELTTEIEKLALIYYFNYFEGPPAAFHMEHARYRAMLPRASFINELTPDGCRWLSHAEVNSILAQSRVGLCLSPVEGPMRAAIEYLFAGLSVVSTPSLGGRDYFFDDEFCIIAEPDPRSIRDAVDALVGRNVPRDYVRAKTLARVEAERRRYIDFVQELIDRDGGTSRFEDRFWECTRGGTLIYWRSMKEFSETVVRAVSGA
jgi:hypothetical protein